jgi:hypothetical protein
LFPVSTKGIPYNIVRLAYFQPWDMWLFDIFFSKKDYNGILSLAIGHKEANRGNVHIAFSFAIHV